LQGVITRLASNSAQCKTWCLTLVTALTALAGATHSIAPIEITILPIVMLLVLDAAYLGVEESYRALYNAAVTEIRARRYALGDVFTAAASLDFCRWLGSHKSWSIWVFYYPLIALYVVAVWFSNLAGLLAAASK